jgi:hypothetical protein
MALGRRFLNTPLNFLQSHFCEKLLTPVVGVGSKEKRRLSCICEEELADRLGQILQNIHIPDDVLRQLEHSLTDGQKTLTLKKKLGKKPWSSGSRRVAVVSTKRIPTNWTAKCRRSSAAKNH